MAYETVDTKTCYGTRSNTCTGYPSSLDTGWMYSGDTVHLPNSDYSIYQSNFVAGQAYYMIKKCNSQIGVTSKWSEGDKQFDSGGMCVHPTDISFLYSRARYTIYYTPPSNLSVVYLNSSTGNDSRAGSGSSCPVKTFARAYSLLAVGGTIHLLNSGADFSSEIVTRNKGYTMDLNGGTGYWYDAKAG